MISVIFICVSLILSSLSSLTGGCHCLLSSPPLPLLLHLLPPPYLHFLFSFFSWYKGSNPGPLHARKYCPLSYASAGHLSSSLESVHLGLLSFLLLFLLFGLGFLVLESCELLIYFGNKLLVTYVLCIYFLTLHIPTFLFVDNSFCRAELFLMV